MQIMKETYLDDNEEFFDYQTGDVKEKDAFDTSKTGFSYYDDFLNSDDLAYVQKEKGLTGKIQMMTPLEYFEECSKFFRKSPDYLLSKTLSDKENISHLMKVLIDYKRKFPIPYLNYTNNAQEGMHRFATVGELFGYDEKFPVLIVTNYEGEN